MKAMTALERMRGALEGGIPDRVPVFPRDLTLGLNVTGVPTPQVCAGDFDAEASSQAMVAAQRALGHDAMVGSVQFVGLETEMLGGKLKFPQWGVPSVAEPAFKTPWDVEEAELPDPLTDAPLCNVVRAYRLTADRLGREVAILGNIEGPVTKAGVLRGLDRLLMDLMEEPALGRKTVEFATRLGTDLIGALALNGVNCATFLAAATDNPDLIGPQWFRELTLPGLRRLTEAGRPWELPTIFHPHGNFTDPSFHDLVDEALAQGVRGFQFAEDNDLAAAKQRWGDGVCVLGGIDTFTTLLFGPEERIRREVEECLRGCAPGGGFVLMPSCSLHRGMPLDHVRAMVGAAHDLWTY
ncbi:uroporphyrinogen decarboxylase family protein [Methanomassiliicoccus luminyensis]|uniref:uroporphyrinogen decarboxylase family protein n=1 Tax=Methanomassiliicoccus luminyensis TaxID=1080712 RepID=UPI000375DC6D|nr:uroporphyrinogen decarboxylase family protein [Methanomassiliicoccus luminyensis]